MSALVALPKTWGESGRIAPASNRTTRERPRHVSSRKEAPTPTIHAFRKGEKGALVISALDFDKAMAVFKELSGSK